MKKIKNIVNYFFKGFSFLASKKVMAILIIVCFVSLLNISLSYRQQLINMEHELFLRENEVIFEKTSEDLKYYNDDVDYVDYGTGMAITNYLKCYQNNVDINNLPDNVKIYINKLKELFDSNKEYFSFYYQDLFSGFTVSYNEDSPIFTASSIKGPAMIYLYEMASLGKINLDEELVYDGSYFSEGSGILKSKEIGTKYTVKDLIYYAIHYSDNIAYGMLMKRFNRGDILAFWNKLGTKHIFTQPTIWGVTSAYDASIYMKELYHFSRDNDTYGKELLDYFKGADWKLITDKDGKYNTASKGGWAGKTIHDATIVFDENPYVFVVMSNTGESNYNYLFETASGIVGNLHEEYWKYKVDLCKDIKQY